MNLVEWLEQVVKFHKKIGSWVNYVRYNAEQYLRYGWAGYLKNILWALEISIIYIDDPGLIRERNKLLKAFEHLPERCMALGGGC